MKRFFETSRDIDAPTARVWQAIAGVMRWPEWTPTVDSIDHVDAPELAIGARFEIRQPKLPQALWQVTELATDPQRRHFTWESTGPGIRTIARHEVVPHGQGARLTLSIEQRGPMGAVAALVWRRLIQDYIETEAYSLEEHVLQTRSW